MIRKIRSYLLATLILSCTQPYLPAKRSVEFNELKELMSRIKTVPARYTNVHPIFYKKVDSSIDISYSTLLRMDTTIIPKLIEILADSTPTLIPNNCSKDHFTYGQLALLLINDIEPVPYLLVTGIQFDVIECSTIPNDFLDYVKTQRIKFMRQYKTYFNSEERKRFIKMI